MSKIKLSPTQIKVLKALAEPGARLLFMPGLDAYWFLLVLRGKTPRIRFETVEKLIVQGFLDTEKDTFGRYKMAIINNEGQEYLKSLEDKT